MKGAAIWHEEISAKKTKAYVAASENGRNGEAAEISKKSA